MALSELETKEALRTATDWLFEKDPPGAAAAREGIANVIPLVMMGDLVPNDIDDLAATVEKNGQTALDPDVPRETSLAELQEAVRAAFEYVKASRASGQ